MLVKNSSPDPAPRRIEVITGEPERRGYDDAFKARLVALSASPGVGIAELARDHGVTPQLLYTWRSEAKRGRLAAAPSAASPLRFAPVVAEDASPRLALDDAMTLEIGEIRLRIGQGVAPERVAAVVRALAGRP